MLKVPLKLKSFAFAPYVADEIFYNLDEAELTRNRLYGGIQLKFTNFISGDIFYLLQSTEKNNDWDSLHVVGTKLKFSF